MTIKEQIQQHNWYIRNAEKKKKYSREHYWKHREKKIKYAIQYRKKYPEKTRKSQLKCSYGITPEKFEQMLNEQDNKCAICKINFSVTKKSLKPHIDHNHKTGVVRGLLCQTCNIGLGHIEREGFLEALKNYLKI